MVADLVPRTSRSSTHDRFPATSDFRERLERAALAPLPGREAQKRFEPPWGFGRHYGPPPHDSAAAAVVVLLYPHDDRIVVPLTLRRDDLTSHAGQISLPGGRIDVGESDADAALRELDEELGVPAAKVVPLAPLTPLYIFATHFHVRPWLAWTDRRPTFAVNSAEVAALLEVSLDDIVDSKNAGTHRRIIRGIEQEVPHITAGTHHIWGATAMILAEVVDLCERAAPVAERAP